MELYILKFSACLLIFLTFYKFVLEKENMHVFKRFFLLGALVLAIVIPLVTFTQYVEPTSLTFDTLFQDIPKTNNFVETETSTSYLPYILWSIYSIGVLLFGFKFVRNLYRLNYKITHNPKQRYYKFTHVLLKDLIVPHTFFNYIFFNKTKFEANDIPEEVFWHEQTHANQKHSIDVLFIEALQVLLWFNPLIYIIKHAIKLNHEFLADQGVLQKGINTNRYQEIILAFSSNAVQPQLANAINYSLIKKRFTVMKTKTTKRGIWLRSLILLPLLAFMLYSFSETKIVEKDIAEATDIVLQDTTNNEGATEAMMTEYMAFAENLEEKELEFKNSINFKGKLNRAVVIYDMMTTEQRESVKKISKTLLMKIRNQAKKGKNPTEIQLESWKNKSEFFIFIDGKTVDNSVLNNYSSTDFVDYFQHKKERSEQFPQPFSVSLYTEKGFANIFGNKYVNIYRSQAKKYTDALSIWLKGNRTDNSELRVLKAQADKIYSTFFKEEIIKYNIKQTPPLPAQSKIEQQKATKAQIKEYNTLAKKYNNMSKDDMYVKKSDVERLKYIYSIMSETQKKDAEPFPNIPPPPPAPKAANPNLPPPPPPPIPDNATPEQRKKYEEAIKNYKLTVAESRQNMARVREVNDAERAELIKAKEQYAVQRKASQEAKLARVAEMKQRQEKLKQEKKERVVEREAITEEQREQLAKVKLREVKERQVEIEKRQEKLKEEKLKYVEERKVLAEQKKEYAIAERAKRQDERLKRDLPPPPPPPKSPINHIVEMAKKDAIFYFEGKVISSDEAIKKLKENKKISIRTYDQGSNSNKPKVYLSTKPIVIEKVEKN